MADVFPAKDDTHPETSTPLYDDSQATTTSTPQDSTPAAEDPRDAELRKLRAQLAGQTVHAPADSTEEWTAPEPPEGWNRNDDGSITADTVPWKGYSV